MRFFSKISSCRLLALLITTLLFFFSTQSVAIQGDSFTESFLISVVSDTPQHDTVIVSYRESLGGTRETLESVTLTIYSDGNMQINRPPYMKEAGTYQAYLEQNTLDHLWQLLTDRNILEFDAILVHNKVQEAKQQQAQLSPIEHISDAPTTFIEIYPNRYRPSALFAQGDLNAKKSISWRGLRWTAEHFSAIEEIQHLLLIQQQLEKIMEQSDLKKIE